MDRPFRAADAAFFSDIVRETHFYLIRHGESEGNARLIMQGHLDLPLNSRGESQAVSAGAWLADKGVKRLYASPLLRAFRTAEILASRAGLPAPVAEPLFTELETGSFTGLSLDEIRQRFPEVYEDFRWRSWDAVPGAESSADLADRAFRGWEFSRPGQGRPRGPWPSCPTADACNGSYGSPSGAEAGCPCCLPATAASST